MTFCPSPSLWNLYKFGLDKEPSIDYSIDMKSTPKKGCEMRCRYTKQGKQCERRARNGWTTCNMHYTAGMNRRSWDRVKKMIGKGLNA